MLKATEDALRVGSFIAAETGGRSDKVEFDIVEVDKV